MAKHHKMDASGVCFVLLCEDIVHKMEEAVKGGKLVSARQCKSLTTKLSGLVAWMWKAVESCDPRYRAALAPLLLLLYRNYEKADLLVKQCAKEDWCVAAVFLYCNWSPFDYVLDSINTWRTMFIECAKELSTTITSMPKLESCEGYFEDEIELRTRLEDLASGRRNSSFRILGFFLRDQVAMKQQHLAQFLLKRKQYCLRFRNTLENLNSFSWEKEDEQVGTWGDVKFLGAGSGASGVLKTSWLGVPCAKKEFHGEASKATFMNEVEIMAQLSHPFIVELICYGNGKGHGDRFIAMELMEKNLAQLIEEQEGVHFSLEVALDIIWQIAMGVSYIHARGVAHRDLKPHNVVIKTLRSQYHEDYYCVKLVDFGLCKSKVEASKSNTISYKGIGTTRYRAPEVHPSAHPKCLGKVNWFKADAYSFAMTCAYILTFNEPFEELDSLSMLYIEMLKGRRPILARECPKELVDLMEQCWSTMVSERPNFTTIDKKLRILMINNMRQSIMNVMTPVGSSKTSNIVRRCDIKKELCLMKEEGHTSFFTAEDVSLCNEVNSKEMDHKHDVMSRLEEGKVSMEYLKSVKMAYQGTVGMEYLETVGFSIQ